MSDKLISEIRTFVNDAVTPSLKKTQISFENSNPQVNKESTNTIDLPSMPKMKKDEEYEKSINEALQGVVIRAQILSEKKGNPDNIEKYKKIVCKAVNEYHIITTEELESGVKATIERDAVKEIQTNIIRAGLLLKEAEKAIAEAEAALKNIESLDLTVSSKVLEVEMKLAQLLELKLDDSTLAKISEAMSRISEIKLEMSKLIVVQPKNTESNFLEWLYVD